MHTMHHIIRGFKAGIVLFRTAPITALAAVVALALGIGFSTTMFAIVHGATRPLPFEEPAAIVAVTKTAKGPDANANTTVADFTAWKDAASFDALGAFASQSANLGDDDDYPERVPVSAVTASTFAVLRTGARTGRVLTAADEEPGAPHVALVSHALWQSRFAGDAALVGGDIRLDGVPFTIIGIMPKGFGFPIHADVWTPLSIGSEAVADLPLQVFGRLRSGTSRAQAAAELEPLARRVAESATTRRGAVGVNVIGFTEIETPREVIQGLYVLLLAVSGVLIIACVNVANLFIARAVARSRDAAVRLALGATRRALLIEQAAETLALSGLAGILGVFMAVTGTQIFQQNTSHIIQAFWVDFSVSPGVLVYVAVLVVLTAAGAAVAPALRSARTNVADTLRDGHSGATAFRIGRLSRVLVSSQIAMACGLLALTLLLGQSALSVYNRAWPFDPGAILSTNVRFAPAMMDDSEGRPRMLRALAEAVERIPGTRAGAISSALPGRGSGNWSFSLDTPPPPEGVSATTNMTLVSPGYFDVVQARLLRGRRLDWTDSPNAPLAVVVNESFVSRYSPDREAIGRQVYLGPDAMTIVGVVSDAMPGRIDARQQDGLYGSITQHRPYAIRAMTTGPADPMTLTRAVRAAVDEVDSEAAMFETFTVREAALREKQVLSVLSSMFGLFGAAALALTAIGLYSVMTFVVAQRNREFSIRLALGAEPRDIVRLVLRQGGRQLATGLAVGIVLAAVMTKAFTAAVEIVQVPLAPLLASVGAAILLASCLALVGPIRQAVATRPLKW